MTWPAITLRLAVSGPTGLPSGSLISTTASSTSYNFSGERVAGHDIDLHSRNADPAAIWGNADTLWAANNINDVSSPFNRVFTYNNISVEVSFGQSSYTVAESDDTSTTDVVENAVEVTVTLSADPKRQVVVPITVTDVGATGADYSGLPESLTFESGETEKRFTFTATHDTLDDDDESVHITFGTLPPGVIGGTNAESVVSITDDDNGVSFERMGYEATEGDSVDVKVVLTSPATREVTIQLDTDKQGGASEDDYSGVQDSITFRSSDTETIIRFTAVDDEDNDDGESVTLRFGTLPPGLVPGPNTEATVTITDNDMPTDRLMSLVVAPKDIDGFDTEVTDYMVGLASTVTQATITATPHRTDDTVTINGAQVTGGSAHTVDLSAGLNSFEVIVDSAATQEQTTYTVYIGRGTTDQGGWKAGDDLDTLRSPGNTSPTGAWSNGTTIWISDPGDAKLYAYTLADGPRDSTRDITLDSNNGNPVGIWSDNTTIWVAELMPTERKVYAYTLADGSRDSDKDITLRGGNTTSWGIWSDGTTMWVADWNDDELYAYTLAGDTSDSDKDITLLGDNTSPRGIWSDGTSIWIVDSSGVKLYAYDLSGGNRVPGYDISLHSSNEGASGIWANDDTAWVVNSATEDGSPFDRVFTYNNIPVKVSFESATYTAAEGSSVTVKVTLSSDPERTVVIPLTAAPQGDTSGDDYSVPSSVTFNAGETTKDVTFIAEMDDADDDGESVRIGFGTSLPAGVTPESPTTTTVSITDDDDPQVTVRFGQASYTVAEGADQTITVNLSADPERTLVIPLTATRQGDTSGDDYSVPGTVTFNTGETSRDITFTATQDDIDDDNESVLLGFGTLPDRVSEATPTEATLSITDDDARGVMVSTITLDVDEGENATYTVVLKSEPTHDVRVTINDPIDNTKVTADPPSLTFTSSDWDTPQTVTVSAAQDEDGANESATVTHTVGGGDYASETLQDVTVTVDDDETTSVTIDPKGITIQPGESNQYSVVLGTEPTVPVTVTVTGHSGTDLLVNPDDLNFDENDWDVPKTVRVSARGSASTDIITLSHTPAGGEYDSVTADDVSVAIVKGSGALTHQVGITASPQSLTVPEGQSSTYSVVLGTIPTADVTVTVNLPTGNDLGVNKPELTFTTGNWNVLQDVRVTAAEDDDGIADNPVTILHTVSGGGYTSSQNFNIVVTIDENDIPGVTPSTVSLVMAEGEMDTYTLKLDTEPSGDVTVTINDPTDNTDVKAEPASLTFTTLNWSAAQTVTVKTEVDHDTVLDTATVTHSVRGGDYGAVTVKDVRVTVTDGCQSFWCGVLEMEKSDRFPEELSFVSLDDDDWDYNNQYYRLNHNVALYGGGQPATTGVPTVAIPERAWLRLEVLGPLQETEHYLDWTLEVNGVELPFSEAKSVWADLPGHWRILFRWYGREFYDLFPPGDDGTGTTLYLSIKETLRANRAATVLGPPLYLTLGPSAANGKNLWASWVRPQMRNDDDHRIYVDKYKIQWKKSSGSWTNPSDVSQETLTPAEASVRYGHAIGGLTPGLDYDVRVIATNGAGDSGPSNVASATVEPVRPRKISMKVVNGKVALTFDRPMDDTSVPAVDTFRVRIGGITLNDVTNVAISGSVVTLTVTTPLHDRAIYGVSYQEPADAADTRLVDQVGNAAVSFGNWVQAQTELRVNTPATGAPGISGLPEVGETLTATTSGIEDEDGLENAVFAYQWLRFELGANSGADIAGATGPTYTLTADDEDKVIKVRVTFTDDAGNEESVISSIGMLVSAALPEPGVPDAPGAPDVSPHAAGALAVSWTAPASDGGSAITGYRVQWKEAAGSWDTPADVTEATVTGTSHTIAGLTDGTAYSVRVLAINDNGEGSTSEDGEGTPHETVPPELSGASVDGAALTLTFNEALDEDSNPAPSAFTVTVSGNTRAVDSVDVSGSDVTLTLASAVTSEDTVTVSYAAPTGESDTRLRDAVGNAAASFTGQTATNETAPPAAQAPDAPGRPDVARHASGSLSVSWDAPSSDGGSPITGYKVQWKAAANSWDTPADVSEAAVTGTGHTIAGLTDGVEYSVRVIAANEAGGSPPSTEQTGTPNETVPPALSTATVDGATLTLNYNEALDDSSAPAASAFTVMVGVNDRGVESVDVTGSAVTLTLASAVTPEDEVVVSYAAPADESAERLRDEAGNPASSFTGEPVTNETGPPPPFTASIHDAPDSHDGQTAFTFELRLSEAPNRGFSYKTLKFHAFNVEGGTVKKAQRMEKGNNMRWTIHVEPDSSADVTVVLPATEDCDAEGAICSGDGRMLSSRLELTVSGPGG